MLGIPYQRNESHKINKEMINFVEITWYYGYQISQAREQ